jgi:hypothetical protein
MNEHPLQASIVKRLRRRNTPIRLYAAQRIEELEKENAELKKALELYAPPPDSGRVANNLTPELVSGRGRPVLSEKQVSQMVCPYPPEPDERDEQIAELRAEVEKYKKFTNGINALISESHGVTGYHLNGDIATWDELDIPNEIAALNPPHNDGGGK